MLSEVAEKTPLLVKEAAWQDREGVLRGWCEAAFWENKWWACY